MNEREEQIGGWIVLAVFFAILAIGAARSQQAQQAPKIEPNQQTERSLQNEQDGNQQPRQPLGSAANVPQVGSSVSEVKGHSEAKHGEEEGTEFWPPFLGYRLKITDTLIAGFTALLFWATLLLWRATRKLVRGADDTAKRQLRPYIFVAKAEIINPDSDSPVGQITIKNFGQTPAYDVTFAAIFKGFNPSDERVFPPAEFDQNSSHFVLAPGQPGCKNIRLETLLNPRTMSSLRARGGHVLYAWGAIEYLDVFGTTHTLEFKTQIGGADGWPNDNLMAIDPAGNKETSR